MRRGQRLAAVLAVVFAFAVTGAALLAVVGASAGEGEAASVPILTPPATTVSGATDEHAAEGVEHDDAERGVGDGRVAEVEAEDPADERTEAPAGADASDADEPASTDPGTTGRGTGDGDGGDQDTGTDDEAEVDEAASGTDAGGQGADHGAADGDGEDDDADREPALGVTEVQDKLREYRFLVGPADGTAGQQTSAAVMAFQRVNGLAVDGVVGPATTAALLAGSVEPTLAGGPADRIEVDLTAQLLHLIEGGERVVTLHVSSGSGGTYETASGGSARSVTPVGSFTVERRIHGVRNAPLGTLYDPLYFYRGFAIHGSPSVPAYPASHGCIRVSRADATWLIERVPDGMPVQLHGGTHVFAP